MILSIKKIFTLVALAYIGYAKAEVELEYTKDGVLRKDSSNSNGCNIIFTNFGMNNGISGLKIQKKGE